MMLDGGDEIYVWIGENTTPEEQYGVTRMVKVIILKKKSKIISSSLQARTTFIHNYKICTFSLSIGVHQEECCSKDI